MIVKKGNKFFWRRTWKTVLVFKEDDTFSKKRSKSSKIVKLSWEEVCEIRKRYQKGESQDSLARAFNTSQPNICSLSPGEPVDMSDTYKIFHAIL